MKQCTFKTCFARVQWTNRNRAKALEVRPQGGRGGGGGGALTFLAERASFLAGGGDMVQEASAVMRLRAGGLAAFFCSSVAPGPPRSTLRAGEDRLLEPFLGVEGVSPAGALLGPGEYWGERRRRKGKYGSHARQHEDGT